MEKGAKLYEGKAKILYQVSDAPNLIIQYFKDDATAFNAQKKGTIGDKGIMNNSISSHLFQLLQKAGVPTHFVRQLSEREMLVKKVAIVPVEVVVRNVIAGSLAKRFGVEEGGVLAEPVLEYYYKDDALGDPMINEDHIRVFNLAKDDEMTVIRNLALRVNGVLKDFFAQRGILLVDFKLEFGRDSQGWILLADEVTPDGCRLWDAKTHEKLDKDRFRRDLGKLEEAYAEVLHRVLS